MDNRSMQNTGRENTTSTQNVNYDLEEKIGQVLRTQGKEEALRQFPNNRGLIERMATEKKWQ